MTCMHWLARLLPLIPLLALASYLKNATPVLLLEASSTIGLSYNRWLIAFLITSLLTILYLVLWLAPGAPEPKGNSQLDISTEWASTVLNLMLGLVAFAMLAALVFA